MTKWQNKWLKRLNKIQGLKIHFVKDGSITFTYKYGHWYPLKVYQIGGPGESRMKLLGRHPGDIEWVGQRNMENVSGKQLERYIVGLLHNNVRTFTTTKKHREVK